MVLSNVIVDITISSRSFMFSLQVSLILACRTGVIFFFAFFRRARASARRARSARHARREGREKNNACTPTTVHAIPPPNTPSNHQPITAFDRSGAKRPVMFREPRTEQPPAKMKDVDKSDENANTEDLPNHFI